MRPGRSSSERRGAADTLTAVVTIVAALALHAHAIAQAPPAATPAASGAPTLQSADCPRCGYRCEAGWRFCPSCGWDLQTLAGEAAGRKLEAIGRQVMGLVVVKPKTQLSDVMSPEKFKKLSRYVGFPEPGQRKAFGTAFPWGTGGLFVTSARILERGTEAQLRTYTNRTYPAEILGYDVPSGIGVLKAEGLSTVALKRGDGEAPTSSPWSWALCYPVNFEERIVRYLPFSLHRGQINGFAQSGAGYVSLENLLRTDHTIPDGCSGGLLIDARGAVTGLILGSPDPGLTYALPVVELGPIVEALSQKKTLQRPYFGLGLVTPDDRHRAKFSLPAREANPLIGYLIPGSPAEKAGAQAGDLLVAVGGRKVATVPEAGAQLLAARPDGGAIALTFLRAGREIGIRIIPGIRPARILLSPADEIQEALEVNLTEVTTGPTVQQGLRLSDLVHGGRGERDGFKDGDIIFGINGKSLRRLATFNDIIRADNGHLFGDGASADAASYASYALELNVRTAAGDKDDRPYMNHFPDFLAAPIY